MGIDIRPSRRSSVCHLAVGLDSLGVVIHSLSYDRFLSSRFCYYLFYLAALLNILEISRPVCCRRTISSNPDFILKFPFFKPPDLFEYVHPRKVVPIIMLPRIHQMLLWPLCVTS